MSKKNDTPVDFELDIDLDATVSSSVAGLSPERIAALKASSDADPEITIAPPPKAVDPDATFSGPLAAFDPDATISNPGGGRRRSNPFAPKALPEALQANLAALGGLNPLIAFANPILSAVPQIAAARNHPDPARLKETLQDLIEAFEAGASKSGVDDETMEGAVYALCCLADDSAASTPWGKDWTTKGLLHELRGEDNGGEEFFELLNATRQNPEDKANLLELMYICLALGFQGRYRRADGTGTSAELDALRADLHALVTRRRPRPAGGLSERWQGVKGAVTRPAPAHAANDPGSVPWVPIGVAAAALLLVFAGYKLFSPPAATPVTPVVSAPVAVAPTVQATAPTVIPVSTAPTVAAVPVAAALSQREAVERELAQDIKGGLIAISDMGGRPTISIRDDQQFASGNTAPTPAVQAIVARIAQALDRTSGPVVVRGYADNVPVKPGPFASNNELSAARAKSVAAAMSARLGAARVTSEGAGEADPIAPNDTEANRARNRRIAILLGPAK